MRIILAVCFHLVATACKKASRSHLSLMSTERRVNRVDATQDGGNKVAEEESLSRDSTNEWLLYNEPRLSWG